ERASSRPDGKRTGPTGSTVRNASATRKLRIHASRKACFNESTILPRPERSSRTRSVSEALSSLTLRVRVRNFRTGVILYSPGPEVGQGNLHYSAQEIATCRSADTAPETNTPAEVAPRGCAAASGAKRVYEKQPCCPGSLSAPHRFPNRHGCLS